MGIKRGYGCKNGSRESGWVSWAYDEMRDGKNVFGADLRILVVENSRHMTGAFVSIVTTATILREEFGLDFEFVLPADSTLFDQVESAGFVCHSLPMIEIRRSWRRVLRYPLRLLVNASRLRRLLGQRRAGILIINDYYNLLGVAAKATGWRGALYTYVRLIPKNQHPVLNWLWSWLAVKFSRGVLAVSKAVAAQLPMSSKVHVLYNSIVVPSDSLAKRDCPAGVVHCLYLANYIAGKGHFDGLRAFEIAYRTFPGLRLRFVGGDMGLKKNRDIRRGLRRVVNEMGLNGVVTVDGYSSDVESDIRASDIVLNLSHSESFSRTCLQASACSRPVIASRCGGPEEIVIDGVSGILVDVGDLRSAAGALSRLAADSSLRESMGQSGRRIAQEHFSRPRLVERWREIFAHNAPGFKGSTR